MERVASGDGARTTAVADALRVEADRRLLIDTLGSVAGGDRQALERLYARTSAKLFGVCLRILPDRQHAEEALQETFLTIWRRADAFDAARGSAMTWLITLARNCAVDRRRALGRPAGALPDGLLDIADTALDPFGAALAADDRRQLRRCLDTLEGVDRQFIAAAFFEGSTYAEVATRAALPLPTVKSRIRRALLKLRECLA